MKLRVMLSTFPPSALRPAQWSSVLPSPSPKLHPRVISMASGLNGKVNELFVSKSVILAFFIDERGNIRTDNVNTTSQRASQSRNVNAVIDTPASSHYGFYLDGDGVAPNGNPAGFGINFPTTSVDKGDYFLRTDYLPNRLFRYDGNRWVKVEDSVRITTTNTDTRGNFKTNFVNNATESTINGLTTKQRQSLTNALKPKADN